MKGALNDRKCATGSSFEYRAGQRYHRLEAERLRQLRAKRALQAKFVARARDRH